MRGEPDANRAPRAAKPVERPSPHPASEPKTPLEEERAKIADRGVQGGRRTPTTRARRTLLARSSTPRERRSEAIAGGEGVRRRANLSSACRALRSRECDAQQPERANGDEDHQGARLRDSKTRVVRTKRRVTDNENPSTLPYLPCRPGSAVDRFSPLDSGSIGRPPAERRLSFEFFRSRETDAASNSARFVVGHGSTAATGAAASKRLARAPFRGSPIALPAR